MGGSNSSIPSPPSYGQSYQEGIDVLLKNLPTLVNTENQYRGSNDPARIQQQQALQAQFGPTQYSQQLDALHQLDPQSASLRASLGTTLGNNLTGGGDPNQSAVYNKLQGNVLGNIGTGDPAQAAVYNQLQGQVQGDLQSGYNLPPDYARELEQSIRGAQSARGNVLGQGAVSAETAFKGKAALDLYQQHLQNAEGFLNTKSPGQLATENAGNFLGLKSPGQQATENVGNFLSGPTPEQQLLAVQGVQPDRSFAYASPTAGTQGANYGLQNYANLVNQQQLQNAQPSPWQTALGVAGQVAGAYFGSGGFSDSRLKENIVHLCKTAIGLPLVAFNYKGRKERYVGTLAEDVQKIRPDAVGERDGYLTVRYDLLDLPFYELKGTALCLG